MMNRRWQRMVRNSNFALFLLASLNPAAGAESGRYLVVAAEGYAGSEPLNQFIAAKTAAGYDVRVYSVAAGTLRAAIKSEIQNWHISGCTEFILLIGDTCGTTAPSTAFNLPHWNGGGSCHAPTDLPYACMDSGDDWYPDAHLGRIPVDTVSELQAFVDKTLFLEAGVFPDPDYVKRAALLATGDSSAQANQTHDAAIANYLEPAGFSCTRIYANQGGGTAQIIGAINNGTLLTIYLGHSSQGGWWEPAFYVDNVPSLQNTGLYGLMLALSCSSAGFDWWYSECLGERMIRAAERGAAVFLGTTTLLPAGGSMWVPCRRIEAYFLESFLVDGIRQIGPLWQATLDRLYTDPDYGPANPVTRDYFELFALLGDPSLPLPTAQQGPNGDFDADGDVDLSDWAAFQSCYAGAEGGLAADDCRVFDFDMDEDVDADDFSAMQLVIGSPR